MDWWDTFIPSFLRRYPDICLGDHWLLIIYFLILQTNSSESLEFFTVLFLRCIAMSCAFVLIYFPDGVLLFFSSRLIVASLEPTMRAISFLFIPNRSLEIFPCKKSDYSRLFHRYSICMLTQYASFVLFQDKMKAKFSNDRFGFIFFWSKARICDLCSQVN